MTEKLYDSANKDALDAKDVAALEDHFGKDSAMKRAKAALQRIQDAVSSFGRDEAPTFSQMEL